MADESIGSVSVNIVGDYSGLEKSFNDSQNLAQQAGTKIAAAFESTAAGAGALTTAVATVATTVEDLAAKSGLAGGELNLFRAALQGSLEAGVPANAALQDMAASSATLGTAVASASQSILKETEAADAAAVALNHESVAAGAATSANQQAGQSFANLGQSVQQTNAEFAKFADGVQSFISHPLQTAGAAAKSFLLEIGPIGAVALGATAAFLELGSAVFGLVKEFGAAAEQTQNMADRLNLSFQATRDLEEMAQIAGVSITGLQQASFRLAESLEGTSANGIKVAKALGDIGVAGETSGELLTGFLQKLAEIPDDTKRIALAHEVLGKSSQQILPLIKNYAELQEAVKSLGPQIDENMAKKLTAADDALDKLSISWSRFKQNIAVFAAPAVQGFVDTLTAFVAGGVVKTIDQQIAEIEAKMVSLGEKSALAGWLMADGFTKGKNAELELLKAQREHLIGVEQAIERSREYNAEIAKSNAAAKAASQPGLVQAIIDKQKELTEAVTASRQAYNTLNQAYQTGTPLANGYAVTSGDVARALANVKAAEAAAATTKVDHTEKTKALTKAMPPLADRTAEWVAQIKAATTEHQKLIAEASKLGEVIGRYVTVAEMAAIKSAALATSLRVANEGFESGDIAIVSYMGHAEKIAPLMDQVADSINKAKQETLDTEPYKKLEAALDALGIKSTQYYRDQVDIAEKAYKEIALHGDDMYTELAEAALISVQKQIDLDLQLNQISRDEYDKTTAQIQHDLDQLDASHEKSTQTRGRHERTLGEDIQAINKRTFDSLERGLASSIVHIKGFDDLWKTLWQGLAQDLLQIMFKTLLDPLEKAIGKVLGGVFGGAGSAAGGAASAGGSAAGGAGSAAGGIAGAAGAAGSSVAGIVSAVGSVVSAVTGVISVFQNMHQETTLNAIEESTRYLKIGLVTQGDSLLNDSHAIRNTLTDFMKWNLDVFQTYLQNMNIDLDKLTNMGGIHTQAATNAISTFSTEKTARVDTGTTINVDMSGANIDSNVSDTRVRDILNRGFRMSKLAGALPAGRFPQ
jgi:hypothetical protein